MAWSSMVPTAPPSVEAMLADQAARWNSYYPQASVAPDEEDLWSVIPKGNMFFSSEQHQPQITMVTGNTRQPFTWQGNNKSLRDAYKATYDAQYQGIPETTTFYDTWKGPEIRALYGAEEQSPMYWQDNDMSGTLDYDIDDTFSNLFPQNSTVSNGNSGLAAVVQRQEQLQQQQQPDSTSKKRRFPSFIPETQEVEPYKREHSIFDLQNREDLVETPDIPSKYEGSMFGRALIERMPQQQMNPWDSEDSTI